MRSLSGTSLASLILLALAACGGGSGGGGTGGGKGGGSGGGTGGTGGGGPSFPTPATYKTVTMPGAPSHLAVDASGNVWVTTGGSAGSLVKVSPDGTVAGTYPLDFAKPNGIAIDSAGNLWVAGTTTPLPARYNGTPYCCAGNPHESVSQVSPSGSVLKNVLLISNNSTPSGNLGSSVLVAIDKQGNVWVTDQAIAQSGGNRNSLFEVSPDGVVIQTVALQNELPSGIAIDAAGTVWLATNSSHVLKITGGAIAGTYDLQGAVNGVGIDSAGLIWVAGGKNAIATALSSSGATSRTAAIPGGESGGFPWGLAIDSAGHVWVSNTDLQGPVAELDSAGALVGNYNDSSAFTGALTDLVIDGAGNVWVGNYNGSVVKIVKAAKGPQAFAYSGPVFP